MTNNEDKSRASEYQGMKKELENAHRYVSIELSTIWNDVPIRRRIQWSRALKSINETWRHLEALQDEDIEV